MQLVLSSAALPGGRIDDLRRAAQRRDLEGLELVLGAEHRREIEAAPGGDRDERTANELSNGEPPVRWVLIEETPSVVDVLYWSRRAHLLDAGLLLRNAVPESPLGVPVALLHPTDRAAAQRAAVWAEIHDAHTCWEVALDQCDPDRIADVLEVTAPRLAHVRLLGAGPEAQNSAPGTTGTGAVFRELALQGYSGTVALVPSEGGSPEDWHRWLFDERGWGCNTAAEKKAAR